MQLNKPFFRKSTDGQFFLYHPDFERATPDSGFSPHTSVSSTPAIMGQYKSEEEMQAKSMELFGERAVPAN